MAREKAADTYAYYYYYYYSDQPVGIIINKNIKLFKWMGDSGPICELCQILAADVNV